MRSLHYEDPLDRIWITCAQRVGLRVVRDPSAYASTDGRGTLQIGSGETLDRDDCLAQMIFHELCHSIIEGPESFEKIDWGLENTDTRHDARERACLRLQAWLTRPRGLAGVLAPTTDFRAFWDELGADPFDASDDSVSVTLAIQGAHRIGSKPWAPHFEQALEATATIAGLMRHHNERPSETLWDRVEPRRDLHPTGAWSAVEGSRAHAESCGSCAWLRGARCVNLGQKTRADLPACERWQDALECQSCAACCRGGFDVVLVGKRERVAKALVPLIESRGDWRQIPRPNGICLALQAAPDSTPKRWECQHYEVRPKSCRDFERGSANCLLARRRVGLSL